MKEIVLKSYSWRVEYYWCFGNESEIVKEFATKNEANQFLKGKKCFDGYEGYGICEPCDVIQKTDGSIVWRFYN